MPSEGPMKELAMIQLPPVASADRLPLPMSPSEMLMRYPLGLPYVSSPTTNNPKLHLPHGLASDPRLWSREDVAYFLRWCETEFDLPTFDMDLFQMNGKALCFLTKTDLNERCSGSGGLVHNVLQILLNTNSVQRSLPASPVTPTSRGARYPFSPLPYSSWYLSELYNAHNAMLNSATLSPAHSTDSTSRSPDHNTDNQASSGFGSGGSTGSHQSDSEEETFVETRPPSAPVAPAGSPPSAEPPPPPLTPITPSMSASRQPQHFFPPDLQPEPNTNGRLLWDFLQQLLNDPSQRYTSFIAWKNHETGVFKIVDPAGLAKLWGIQKNHLSMNYDKMSRALRYYYRVNILRKVQGERHCYQFLRNPSELKNIKNISLLRQQMSLQKQQQHPVAQPQVQPSYNLAAVKRERDPEPAQMEFDVGAPIIKREPEYPAMADAEGNNEPTDLSTPRTQDRCETLRVSIFKTE